MIRNLLWKQRVGRSRDATLATKNLSPPCQIKSEWLLIPCKTSILNTSKKWFSCFSCDEDLIVVKLDLVLHAHRSKPNLSICCAYALYLRIYGIKNENKHDTWTNYNPDSEFKFGTLVINSDVTNKFWRIFSRSESWLFGQSQTVRIHNRSKLNSHDVHFLDSFTH
jgi:hypothetical protein